MRPWPPGAAARRLPPSPRSLIGQLERVGAVAERDRGARPAGVLDARWSAPPAGSGRPTGRRSGRAAAARPRPRGRPAGRRRASARAASSRSASPGCGARAGRRRRRARSSLSVRCISAIACAAEVGDPVGGRRVTRSSGTVAPSACAWTTIRLTLCATTSCSSCAIRTRSSATARSASSSRSRSSRSARSLQRLELVRVGCRRRGRGRR